MVGEVSTERPALLRVPCGWRVLGRASAIAALFAAVSPMGVMAQTATPAGSESKAADAKAPAKAKKAVAKKVDDAKPEQSEADKAGKLYDGAMKLAQAGKHEQAAQGFTAALAGGKLPKATMARALYQRGIAHRKLGKPVQAIADLTSATWLKDGLNDTERADAVAQQAAARKEAGLAETAGATKPAVAAAAGGTVADAPPINWAATPSRSRTAPDAAATPAATPPPASTATAGVGGFLSGLFGGATAAAEPERKPIASPVAAPAAPPTSAVSSWQPATEVTGKRRDAARPEPTKAFQTAAIPATPTQAVAATPATTAPTVGKYRLQVAAVRSTEEAQGIAKRLKAEHGAAIGARVPEIAQTVHGNMGTFYRVNIGPYSDAQESQSICGRIRAGGLDCMVLAR